MSTNLLQSLRQTSAFEIDGSSEIELIEALESTAATLTRFKLHAQNNVVNLIYKEFRADWIGGGNAELNWYSQFTSIIQSKISPAFYGGSIDRQIPHCFLFLEDVTETHYKVPDSWSATKAELGLFQQVVDMLLQLHTCWWNHDRLDEDTFVKPQGGPLRLAHAATRETINKYAKSLHHSLPDIIDNLKPELPLGWITIYEQALQTWPFLLTQRIREGKNLTLLHGDCHIWNIFFPHQPQQHKLLLVDWETYKRGLGVYDLAYCLITCLDISTRQTIEKSLLKQYHNGLQAAGIENYDWQTCLQDYRLAIIANLFPPLMWKSAERIKQAIMAFEDWNCTELLR